MKRKKWLLTLAILAATSGCAGLEDCRYESAQRLRAMAQYHECGAPACERFPKDYKRGYLDGFYTVSTGGPCCPPAVAPSKYWRVANVIGECDNPRHSYYSGWQDGASRASCFPDSHHLRIFETCECTVPRCEGCGPQGVCTTGSGGCGCNQAVADGLIHGEYGVPTGTVVGNDPIYSEAYDPLPEIIPAPIGVPDEQTDDADEQDRDEDPRSSDSEENQDDSDADDRDPPTPTASDADNDDAMDLDGDGDNDDDDVLSPSDVQSDRSEAGSERIERPEAQSLSRNGRSRHNPVTADDRLIPIEGWDAGMVDSDFDVAVVRRLDAGVDPTRRGGSRDARLSSGPARDLPTSELDSQTAAVTESETQPLDRATIQALFGVERMFDPSATGTVSYQETDPIKSTTTSISPSTNATPPSVAEVAPGTTAISRIAPLIEMPSPAVREAAFDPAATETESSE